jgi:diguanylate cyclase (GGDEF)-like protein
MSQRHELAGAGAALGPGGARPGCGLKARTGRTDTVFVTDAAPTPSPGDATSAALARIGAGLAAVHLVFAVLSLSLVETPHRALLVVLDVVVALVFAAIAGLVGTRHLPGWRRDEVAAAIPVVAAAATAARLMTLQAAWPAAEFVLAVAVTAFVTADRWFRAAVGACLALAALSLGVAAVLPDASDPAAAWLTIAAVIAAAAGSTVAIRHVRVHSDAVVDTTRRQLAEQSVRDPITGVANRQGLLLVARPMMDLARRQGEAVHCVIVDVDARRGFTEERRASTGDDLLGAVAEALRTATRTTDVIARWDGDEFVVLGPGTGTSPLEMERRIRSHLALAQEVSPEDWQGRISAGVATLVPWDADDLDGLMQRAGQDMALRRSLRRRASAEVHDDTPPVRAVRSGDDARTAGESPRSDQG